MAFVKKTWKDRLVEFAGRRTLTKVSGSIDGSLVVDVARNEGEVSQAGDAFSASNMNDLEDRIDEAFKEVNANLPFAFGVDANGNYGYIKEGADTVTPFRNKLKITTIYSGLSNYSRTINVTQYDGWKNFTINNFVFLQSNIYEKEGMTVHASTGPLRFTSYNASTGILTVSQCTDYATESKFDIYISYTVGLIQLE